MLASPQTIRRFLAALVLACSFAASADAAIITQTQNNPFSVNLASQLLNWNQFNPILGSLLSVEYYVDGTLTGTFTVTNTSASQITVLNSQNQYRNQFIGAGAPAFFLGPVLTPVLTTPVTHGLGTDIAANSSQLFTVDTLPAPQTMSVPSTNLTGSAAYFTGLGTVNSTIQQLPSLTVSNIFAVEITSALDNSGIATLVYRYDDSTRAVPEPSTVAFAGIGLFAFAAQRFRSKKRAKATPAVA